MKKYFILTFLMGFIGFSQSNNQKELSDIFPNDGISQQETTGFSFTKNYIPSGSIWAVTWNESHVYRCLMKYTHPTNSNLSYELRVGKGGQIYSFKTASGESIPPQWRGNDPIYGSQYAPWIDEVWQLVAVDKSQNVPANDRSYFIHQAGVYLKDPANLTTPFYSPQIAEYYDDLNQEYTTVNWGQHAHVGDNLTAGFTSTILYYTKFKNIGNGIIQVDYIMYNFGTDKIGHINMPWGGVRHSSYPNFFVSNSDNTFAHKTGIFGDSSFPTSSTNGWVAFSSNDSGSLPSLGLLADHSFGTTALGDAGNLSNRNYTVYSGIRTNIDLSFGKQLRIRNYFILKNSVTDIQSTIATLDLANKTYYGIETKTKTEVPSTKYFFASTNTSLSANNTTNSNGLSLQLQPYQNSYPLFIIQGENNVFRITSNLYTFSHLPYDKKTVDIKLIGFSDTKKTINLEEATVTYGGSYKFPDGITQNNITEQTVHFSDLGVDSNGYNQLIQTTVSVTSENILQSGNIWYHNYGSNEFNAPTVSTTGIFLEQGNAVTNPSLIGNTSAKVAKFTKDASANSYIRFALPGSITAANKTSAIFKIKLYVPLNATTTNNNFKIILREGNSTTNQVSLSQTITNFDVWQEYTFDFSSLAFTGTNYDYLNLFIAQPDTDSDATGNIYNFDAFQGPYNEALSVRAFMNSVNVYPNPILNTLNISEEIRSAKLYSSIGQILQVYKSGKSFDVSSFPKGVYILKMTLQSGLEKSIRFIKK